MTLPIRVAMHLMVLGMAVAAVTLRPAHPSVAPGGTHIAVAIPQPRTVALPLASRVIATTGRPRPATSSGQPAVAEPSAARRPTRTTSRPRPATRPAPAPVVAHTDQATLAAAIARIPSYRPGVVRWVISDRYYYWGTADWYHRVIYIFPGVPVSRLYDVAVHEWSHELSVLDYGGNVAAAVRAMDAYFGGSGLQGAEVAADCMAILQGAVWTHYTHCADHQWQVGAARLVDGRRL